MATGPEPHHMTVWDDDRFLGLLGISPHLAAGNADIESSKFAQGNDAALAKVGDDSIKEGFNDGGNVLAFDASLVTYFRY
jgi:hypothetical protein